MSYEKFITDFLNIKPSDLDKISTSTRSDGSVFIRVRLAQKSTLCYLLCGNGLDPHVTSHLWRARCWGLREDTGRTRRRKGLFLGLVLPFCFPQIHIPQPRLKQ